MLAWLMIRQYETYIDVNKLSYCQVEGFDKSMQFVHVLLGILFFYQTASCAGEYNNIPIVEDAYHTGRYREY